MAKSQDITKQRVLRAGRSVWADFPRSTVRHHSVPKTQKYDIIIVGIGISGALTAHALADGKRRILIIDRRQPLKGSTLASTAMIQHEIDVPLHKLAALIGRKDAERAWVRSARAVEALVSMCRSNGISCAMRKKKTLYLAGDELGARALKTEVDCRRAANLDATYLAAADLQTQFKLGRTAAIVSAPSASANPVQLTAGFIRKAQSKGLEVVSPVEITDVASHTGGVALATGDGRILLASRAIFCTGYEFLTRLQSRKHSVVSTWALAVKPVSKLPAYMDEYLVWEASDPYLYFRKAGNGDIVAGGEDENDPEAHKDPSKLRRKSGIIAAKLERLLGVKLAKPHHIWAAAFGTTTTGLPYIGTMPDMPNVYAVMGFGGNGITFSQIAAEILSAEIRGDYDPDADVFRFPGSI